MIRSIEKGARGSPVDQIHAELKDSIVMTTYNRKTYRITDVDFKINPMSTFETSKGVTNYVDYYKSRYDQTITDFKQPVLVAKPSKKDLHGGKEQVINLIPEFCQLTGLSDAMRENFTLMKELSKYLHVGPQERVKEINSFMKRLTDTTSVKKVIII
jgi:aubergine-like protein